jgi:hypothetical protein
MTTGALIWLAAFGLSAVVFFAIGACVTVRGARELRELLSPARRMAPTFASRPDSREKLR